MPCLPLPCRVYLVLPLRMRTRRTYATGCLHTAGYRVCRTTLLAAWRGITNRLANRIAIASLPTGSLPRTGHYNGWFARTFGLVRVAVVGYFAPGLIIRSGRMVVVDGRSPTAWRPLWWARVVLRA
jgi:hypothetical protein